MLVSIIGIKEEVPVISYIRYLEISYWHCHSIPIALTYFRTGNKMENSIYHLIMSKVKA